MKLLIVVDMQNDFVSGTLGSSDAKAIVPNVVKKVKEYASNEDAILFTRDTHTANYFYTQEGKNLPVAHCIQGSTGWEIIPELSKYCFENYVVDKPTFGFYDLDGAVKRIARNWKTEITEVEFVGVCTDICVISNALLLKAFNPELLISCDSSCCAGVSPEKHEAALEVMRSCQIRVY